MYTKPEKYCINNVYSQMYKYILVNTNIIIQEALINIFTTKLTMFELTSGILRT